MQSKWVLTLALASALTAVSACGPRIDLAKSLEVTDVLSGWYDFGVVDGMNKLVPSISFRLRNVGDRPVNEVQLTVSFWQEGADGENDSQEVTGIGRNAVKPGETSDPILVRSGVGYTISQPRSELFTHPEFKDFSAKLFAKRDGRIVKIGEFKLERRLIPHLAQATVRP